MTELGATPVSDKEVPAVREKLGQKKQCGQGSSVWSVLVREAAQLAKNG